VPEPARVHRTVSPESSSVYSAPATMAAPAGRGYLRQHRMGRAGFIVVWHVIAASLAWPDSTITTARLHCGQTSVVPTWRS
jgi:hypothetical protein